MTQALYFLPGWCLGRGPLQSAVDALGGQFFDLPGYGTASAIANFDAAVADIAARLPAAAHLCGWSLGAQLALAVAARFPEKVSKLVLIAGTVSFIQRDGWPHGMPPAMLAEFAAAIAADAEAMLPRFVGGFNRGDAQAKAVTLELLKLADPRPSAEVLGLGLDWLRDVDLRAYAGKVQAATLLVQGAADPLMPQATGEALAQMIPGARLAIFADCAHAPFTSQPAAFHAAVRSFLDE